MTKQCLKRAGIVGAYAITVAASLAAEPWERKIVIEEPFGLAWGPDRIDERIECPPGAVSAGGIALTDAEGAPVPAQLSEIERWEDGASVRRAVLSFMATLAPNQRGVWTLRAGSAPTPRLPSAVGVRRTEAGLELTNALTGIRLPAPPAAGAAGVTNPPAPILGVRLSDGAWIGRGWWETDVACTGYTVEVEAEGPVFARARLRYGFEGGRFYSAVVELNAGQDVAVLTEEYNLSEGRRYPMSGLDGMSPEERYAYVLPTFDSPDKKLMWDWWGQTMANLPTPNAYCFSFYDGLEPDSADFYGRSQYGNLRAGDGGLTYDKEGRFGYLNAYLQWGDEEALYFGFWNRGRPERQIAFLALRPSRWLHPDISPHPHATLRQYVQTTCPVFLRRKAGDAYLRAPVCLGRRVYGVGGVARTFGRHDVPERQGPVTGTNDTWGANLMLRHIRLGRLELNDVRRWVLAYDEPALYPRVYVPPGDRARYESRRTGRPLDETARELAARKEPTPEERKVVADALAALSRMVRHFARCEYGHMDYGINEGLVADPAESALASPACTPEQAAEIRRWLAAILYNALHPDYVPPREAGFAWGSANMMAQVQCRACPLAALLPHHPEGPAWRRRLAHAVTLYVEDQINEAGATLECPHYGQMAIVMPALALAALANAGDADLTRAERRFRAAARHRLATLLPYDVRGGLRSVAPVGDGYYERDITFAALAGFFQARDPQLASHLVWGLRESGNALSREWHAADATYKILDPGRTPAVPDLRSEFFRGYGFVMRHGFPSREEAYLQVQAGNFSWGHGHNDRGCWILYAHGAPLMADFAAIYYPSMREQWMHPGGLTFDHDETPRPPDPGPRDDWWRKNPGYRDLKTAPFTVVEMRNSPRGTNVFETFGDVTRFRAEPAADYAALRRRVSYLHRVPFCLGNPHGKDLFDDSTREEVWLNRPFDWTRQYLWIKDAPVPGQAYLVIRDDLTGNTELNPSLNLWCLAEKVEVNGQTAVYTGRHGVDLHVFVARPASFTPATRALGHAYAGAFADAYRAAFGQPFREEQIQLRIPQTRRDGGYFVAMVPVKRGDPAPRFEVLAEGRALRVAFADRTDVVLLGPPGGEIKVDGHRLRGEAALLTARAGKERAHVVQP